MKTAMIILFALALSFQIAEASPESHAQATRDMMKAMGFEKMAEISVKSAAEAYARQTAQPAKARPKLEAVLRSAIGAKAIEADVAKIYQKHFSENEIQDLLKFYSSPTGTKMSSLQTTLLKELAAVGEAKVNARQAEIQKILKEFSKK